MSDQTTEFKFECPHCGQRLEAEVELVGMGIGLFCNSGQKAKWKVVDGKVEVSPGDYSVEDLDAMLKEIQCACERCAKCNGRFTK